MVAFLAPLFRDGLELYRSRPKKTNRKDAKSAKIKLFLPPFAFLASLRLIIGYT